MAKLPNTIIPFNNAQRAPEQGAADPQAANQHVEGENLSVREILLQIKQILSAAPQPVDLAVPDVTTAQMPGKGRTEDSLSMLANHMQTAGLDDEWTGLDGTLRG